MQAQASVCCLCVRGKWMFQLQAIDLELPLMRFILNRLHSPNMLDLLVFIFSLCIATSDVKNKRRRASTQWDRCPSVRSPHCSGNGQQAGGGVDFPQSSPLLYLCCSVCTQYGQMVSDMHSVSFVSHCSVIDNRVLVKRTINT